MQKLIVTIGLPASGKSTWAKEVAESAPLDIVRVNRDDIRDMLGLYWVPKREKLVTKIERQAMSDALKLGYTVIVDATNLKKREFFKELAKSFSIKYEEKSFLDVPLKVCLERDAKRERPVGEEVIMRMHNSLKG